MKSTFAIIAVSALSALALPAVKRQEIDDKTILNFALTLEHLENAFYKGALEQFDEKAFADAGLPSFARGRFAQVAAHEEAHVNFLAAALGDDATQPCTYKFPYTDPKSFAALSQVLEGVGVSAYAGAAQLIQNKDYLTAAAVVLSTEARHAGWVASAVNKVAAWSGALDTPLGLNQIFTLAAQFIVECPAENPALPVKAFPTLTVSGTAKPGSTVDVTFEGIDSSAEYFVTFFNGLSSHVVAVMEGKVMIPEGLVGQTYAVLTSDNSTASDSTILAGPAILIFEMNSKGEIIA